MEADGVHCTIALPVSERQVARKAIDCVRIPLSGRRVLIVEDEYFLADELDRSLRSAGALVLGPAASVEAALDLLGREAVDVASIEVNLGGTMGLRTAILLARPA